MGRASGRCRNQDGFVYPDVEKLNSLSWKSSPPEDAETYSFIGGFEGHGGDAGIFSLEEISECEYALEIPNTGSGNKKKVTSNSVKLGKRKFREQDDCLSSGVDESMEAVIEEAKVITKKKRNKNRKTDREKNSVEVTTICNTGGNTVRDATDTPTFHAWDDLRLHPLLMRSLYRLGFREPTPIQKACIPLAAHQGKDVAGAAETGSGKTLAFGLPILQRLLEERERSLPTVAVNGKDFDADGLEGLIRALIIAPTRELALQVSNHIKEVAKGTNIMVVPVVGGMSLQKQERLLRRRPHIVVGTPGRLWELMSEGKSHLTKLHNLSFFVLDEADRMIENGHFNELHSILDMLPMASGPLQIESTNAKDSSSLSSFQRKKRQTFVFSATIALSPEFRKKLKHRSLKLKEVTNGFNSIEALSALAGMKVDTAIVDLTNVSVLATKLEESFIDCKEADKDAYLYYLLCIHGQGRTIVFCTSIAALRHISSLLRILEINIWTLHAQMQQRARLKAIDRFRGHENSILVATDVAARGLDIPGIRTVVHYQLPHSAEVYIHRSGRTARASSDGCSIALISPKERSKFASLCKSFSKDDFQRFPLDSSYMPEVLRRLSLAHKIDKILYKDSQEKAKQNWVERNANMAELVIERDDSEDEKVQRSREKKVSSFLLHKLQQELHALVSRPLQPRSLSHRFVAGAGVTPLLQQQFVELIGRKRGKDLEGCRGELVVMGQDCMEPLEALRNSGQKVRINTNEIAGRRRRNMENLRKRKREMKDLRRKRKKELQAQA